MSPCRGKCEEKFDGIRRTIPGAPDFDLHGYCAGGCRPCHRGPTRHERRQLPDEADPPGGAERARRRHLFDLEFDRDSPTARIGRHAWPLLYGTVREEDNERAQVAALRRDDLAALATQAQAVGRRLQARLDAVQQLERAPAATGRRETDRENDRNLARIEAVFGRELRVLPVFKPANAGDLASAFEASESLQGDEPWPVMTFFQRAARVRDRVARLDLVFTYADAVTRSVPMRLRVAQLPYAPRARWLALPLRTANEEPLGGRLSLVAHLRGTMSPRASLTGLVVDEWVEVIPKRRETTGVAFHYDQPGAQAPQALLLAVPVEGQQAWTRDALAETVLDALELAQLRAVDAQALAEGGHFLPALYFAFNVKGDSVSTDFKRVAATPP